MAAQEIVDLGEAMIEEADIVADWQRSSFDIAASTIGVFDGGRLVGYAEVSGSGRGDAAVDPEYRGRGLGTALATWMQETARRAGDTTIGMPVPEGSAGEKLLRSLGYQPRWTSWVLALLDGKTVLEQPLPEGFAMRAAEPGDHTAAWTVAEDAFLEWSKRERQPYEDWAAGVLRRPGFEPWMLRDRRRPGRCRGRDLARRGGRRMRLRGQASCPSRTSVGAASRAHSWPTRSRSRGSTAHTVRSCPPTHAPAHSICISSSGWRSPPPG